MSQERTFSGDKELHAHYVSNQVVLFIVFWLLSLSLSLTHSLASIVLSHPENIEQMDAKGAFETAATNEHNCWKLNWKTNDSFCELPKNGFRVCVVLLNELQTQHKNKQFYSFWIC